LLSACCSRWEIEAPEFSLPSKGAVWAAHKFSAPSQSSIRAPAHSLKSSSANVGALRLSSAAREMEENARAGEQDKVIAGLAGLELEHEVSNRVLMNIDKNFFE